MPTKFCPRCNQMFVYSADNTDYVHDCGNQSGAGVSETLRNEDVPNIGSFSDPDGSTGNESAPNIGLQGSANTASPRAKSEGAREFKRTSRGYNKATNRTRKHFEHIDGLNGKPDNDDFNVKPGSY